MFGPVLLEKCCTAVGVMNATTCMRHDPFAVAISITIRANLATFALYSGVNFMDPSFEAPLLQLLLSKPLCLFPQSGDAARVTL